MPGLIRRTLLIGAAAAAAGGLASWALRPRAATEIAYGTGPRQVMDLTLPGTAGPHPVLLMIHGGGFRTGDKTDLAIWPELTEAGIAVARLNTRRSDTDRLNNDVATQRRRPSSKENSATSDTNRDPSRARAVCTTTSKELATFASMTSTGRSTA